MERQCCVTSRFVSLIMAADLGRISRASVAALFVQAEEDSAVRLLSRSKSIFRNWTMKMFLIRLFQFLLTILASTLPVPSGSLIPIFKMGAAFGRIIGEAMYLWFPEGLRIGSTTSAILPGNTFIESSRFRPTLKLCQTLKIFFKKSEKNTTDSQ